MTQFALISLVMVAFAANSLMSRAGISVYGLDALAFAGFRLAAGAVMLAILVVLRSGWPKDMRARAPEAAMLLVYLVPFSLAYLTMPAGAGALILFGVVQITMFVGAMIAGAQPRLLHWLGMIVAMAGLSWLMWPTQGTSFHPLGVICMVIAGIGWGLFSLRGRQSKDPLADMCVSFVLLLPVAIILILYGGGWSVPGVVVAVLCGAVTSGLGYALWYHVLPGLSSPTAAVAQLSVPVIALLGGAAVLGEALTVPLVLGATIVLGGIAISVIKRG